MVKIIVMKLRILTLSLLCIYCLYVTTIIMRRTVKCLPCAKHCSPCFTCITILNLHILWNKNSFSSFTQMKAEIQNATDLLRATIIMRPGFGPWYWRTSPRESGLFAIAFSYLSRITFFFFLTSSRTHSATQWIFHAHRTTEGHAGGRSHLT